MSDLISRQAAIAAVGYYSLHSGDKLLFADAPLKALPTVDPPKELICSVTVDTDEIIERIKERGWEPVEHGRWIEHHYAGGMYFRCSNCKAEGYGRYCPNCGAKMDEEDGHDDHL